MVSNRMEWREGGREGRVGGKGGWEGREGGREGRVGGKGGWEGEREGEKGGRKGEERRAIMIFIT